MAYVESKIIVRNRINDKYVHSAVLGGMSRTMDDMLEAEGIHPWYNGWNAPEGLSYRPAKELYPRLIKLKQLITDNPDLFKKNLWFKRIKGHWEWDVSYDDIYQQALEYIDYLLKELKPYQNSRAVVEIM